MIAYEPPSRFSYKVLSGAAGARPRRHRRADAERATAPRSSTRCARRRPCRWSAAPWSPCVKQGIKQLLERRRRRVRAARRRGEWLRAGPRPAALRESPRAAARPEAALARAPARWRSRLPSPRCCCVVAGVVVAYELLKRPADVHNPNATFKPQKPPKPEARRRSTGRSSARPRPAPATCRRRGSSRRSASSGATPSGRCSSSRRSIVGGKLYFGQQQRLRLRPRRRHRQGALGTPDRPPQRLLADLLQAPPLHRQPRPRPHRQARREDRQDRSGNARCRAGPSPRRWSIGRTVYFGCEDGDLFALSTRNGNVRWATTLGGPVKSAPAYYGGVLYVGDYGGYMNAVDAKTGKLKWQSGSLGPGLRHLGRVLLDPRRRLRPRLRRQQRRPRLQLRPQRRRPSPGATRPAATSTRARPSPAPATARPTVYIGSFDGNVYALNAKDGEPALEPLGRRPGGRLALAVGNIVYAAEFTDNTTTGFTMRSGRTVFRYPPRHLHAGRSPTAAASTWSATRASPRCSRTSTRRPCAGESRQASRSARRAEAAQRRKLSSRR